MEYRDPTPISPDEIDYDESKVDTRVSHYTKQVREKMHGIDTREAMARAEEISSVVSTEAKEISVETKGRQDILEQQFDDQISNMTLEDPSSAEIVAAQTNRKTGENWQTIGNRLDDENNRLTAQLAQTTIQVSETKTVGVGGDFDTINDALEYFSKKHIQSSADNITGEIKLLSGFEMTEQVFVDGMNLGWIIISSVDEEVTIDRQHLIKEFVTDAFPAFGAKNGATLPVINALFQMNATGTETYRSGIYVTDNSSAIVNPNYGVKNAGRWGLAVVNSSKAVAKGAIFTNAVQHGVMAIYGSTISCDGVDASHAGITGIFAYHASTISAEGSTATDCGQHGVYSNSSSMVNAREGVFSRSKLDCIRAVRGSSIDAENSELSGALEHGAYATRASTINILGANVSSSKIGVKAENASTIHARDVNADNCTNHGFVADFLSTINAENATANNVSLDAVRVLNGSIFNGNDMKANDAGLSAFVATGGSTMNLSRAEGKRAKGTSGQGAHWEGNSRGEANGADFSNAVFRGVYIERGCNVSLQGANCSGAGNRGIQINNSYANINEIDARVTSGVDSSSDIQVFLGSFVSARNVVGGFNIPTNTIHLSGIIIN